MNSQLNEQKFAPVMCNDVMYDNDLSGLHERN